jgi:hypothetical protein
LPRVPKDFASAKGAYCLPRTIYRLRFEEVHMSGTRRTALAGLLVLALAPGARGWTAELTASPCANGAVNTITGNYVDQGAGLGDEEGFAPSHCEICLIVRVQVGADGPRGSWEEAGRVCNLWTDAQAHEVMFKIGQCGLIVPEFEAVGQFYGTAVPTRIEAIRLPPCM